MVAYKSVTYLVFIVFYANKSNENCDIKKNVSGQFMKLDSLLHVS
jgi:hypothetical protein